MEETHADHTTVSYCEQFFSDLASGGRPGAPAVTWKPCCTGPVTVQCRVVDDSGNVEANVSEITVIVEQSE